jgi:hypothetical protein
MHHSGLPNCSLPVGLYYILELVADFCMVDGRDGLLLQYAKQEWDMVSTSFGVVQCALIYSRSADATLFHAVVADLSLYIVS